MNERRKTKRSELSSRLIIKQLDGKGENEIAIEVEDVSKTGIGFTSIEIVRIEKKGDVFEYGAIFIGMPEMEAARIEVYQTVNDMN